MTELCKPCLQIRNTLVTVSMPESFSGSNQQISHNQHNILNHLGLHRLHPLLQLVMYFFELTPKMSLHPLTATVPLLLQRVHARAVMLLPDSPNTSITCEFIPNGAESISNGLIA